MKLLNLVVDKFIDTKLYEMARSRDDAKRIITGLSVPIFEHFIKLFVFNLPQAKDHWIKELNIWFYQIDDIHLKPSHKKVDARTLYKWLVFDASPHYTSEWISDRIEKMIYREYNSVNIYDYDAEHLLNILLRIINQIALDIDSNKFTKIEDYLP